MPHDAADGQRNYALIIRSYLNRSPIADTAAGSIPDLSTDRPIHRPLRTYALARAARIAPSLWASLDPATLAPLRDAVNSSADITATLPASVGNRICTIAWSALALYAADTTSDLARRGADILTRLGSAQRPDGSFFTPARADNPETLWYHELVLLHAVSSYALLTNTPHLLDAAQRAALYHLHETQPDHATTQPWALNAFLLSPDTYPLADQLLHTLQTQHPTGPDPISSILLADTLLSLP